MSTQYANKKIIVPIDDEEILEIIPIYMQSCRNELVVLQDALAQKNFEILSNIGHKMKGSGGGFGLVRISEIGGTIESSAKAQDLPAIAGEIADLQDYLERVEVVGA